MGARVDLGGGAAWGRGTLCAACNRVREVSGLIEVAVDTEACEHGLLSTCEEMLLRLAATRAGAEGAGRAARDLFGAGKARCCSASSSLSLESLSLRFPAFEAVEARRGRLCKTSSGFAAVERGRIARRRNAGAVASAGCLGEGCWQRCFASEGLLSSERKSPAKGLAVATARGAGCAARSRRGLSTDGREQVDSG